MQTQANIARVLDSLAGLEVSRAESPVGYVLSLDLGTLGRSADATTEERTHGWRHLTVLSPWRIESTDGTICDWVACVEAPRSALPLSFLRGKRVHEARSRAPTWDLVIHFDGGLLLTVFTSRSKDREDGWFVLGTDGVEVAGVPQLVPQGARGAEDVAG